MYVKYIAEFPPKSRNKVITSILPASFLQKEAIPFLASKYHHSMKNNLSPFQEKNILLICRENNVPSCMTIANCQYPYINIVPTDIATQTLF